MNGNLGNNICVGINILKGALVIEDLKIDCIITLLVFGALFVGGNLIQIIFHFNKNSFNFQILCGGLLTGIFAFDILPDAFSHFNAVGVLTGILVGIFIMIAMEVLLHKKSHPYNKNNETVYLLFVALLIHSIPTGITFGMSLQQGHLINYGLLLAFIFHHIPEGIIIMSTIPHSKRNREFMIFCFMLSIVIGMNVFLGLNMRIDSVVWSTIMMGMTIGTMGYVTFYELLWKKSKNLPKGKVALLVLLGMMGVHYFLQFLPTHH
jgi:zinc transporter ZupT